MLKTVAWEEAGKEEKDASAPASVSVADCEARVEQAEARTEQAEARTEQAKSRTEHAETRREHAETRTEQAESRTEEAKARTERAETRTEQAETRTEQAIRDSELSYRRLFEASKDGILILEADTGRIRDVNPSLVELLGSSHDELVNQAIWELGPFRDIMANKTKFEDLQAQGYARFENLALETKDGRKITVEFISNVYQAGAHNVIQCTVRDNTERKRGEDRSRALNAELEERVLERTSQLQSANEELDSFCSSVSHDLRSPLRHLLGYVEVLRTDAEPALSEKNLENLAKISQAADRMGILIDNLLAFSRLGQSEIEMSDVSLDELLQEALVDFKAEIHERKIAMEIQPLPVVRADRALLRLAFVNLVSNAVKFTRARLDPKIHIGCAAGAPGKTTIFIRDNGTGFDPARADGLFGVFQRLHAETQFEGVGIGLANVRRIIQRHGGKVWAEGIIDGGATFYVSIHKLSGPPNCEDLFPSGA